jgi:ferric-dicitrate binding protein FerR (iron transport regulator)
METNQNIDFEIIWKKIHNQINEEEEILLNTWLEQKTSHRKYFENAVRYYRDGSQHSNSSAELKKALRNIHQKAGIHSPYRNTQIVAITSIAASILFIIYFQFFNAEKHEAIKTEQVAQSIVPGSTKAILILSDGSEHDLTAASSSIIATDGTEIKNTGTKLEYSGQASNPAETRYNTLKIPRGGEYYLVLSDSTKVWLNSETTLRFPIQFANDVRRVELTGEAFFEVTRNTNLPFIVTSGNQTVKVLGTQFNVASYADNQNIYTTLVEGRVEVSLLNNPEEKIILKPNEQSTISQTDNKIQKQTVDASQYVAWKDGRFVFHNQMLEEIMKTLSKWYNVNVVFDREELKKVRFTGNLERYANFSDILGKIERTNEVKFEIEKNLITIK